MRHFGVISPPVSGHIHPFSALGRELIARGHRVTYLQVADLEEKIRGEGLEFQQLGASDHPPGSLTPSLSALGRLEGLAALRFTIAAVAKTSVMVCRDAPEAIERAGIDALLVDQMEPAGGAVAEHLRLPFFTICNALTINRDPVAPPPFTDWGYHDVWWARARNAVGYAASDRLTRPITMAVAEYRARWGLAPLASPDDSFSPLAQISQMYPKLDFPRKALPKGFHYVGPLRDAGPRKISFPWDRLDGRPLIYASLGTLQNSREPVFSCFAEACQGIDAQLVITHGGGLTEKEERGLPGVPLVVPYAPQDELLARARLTLSHAGLNTVLDSLTHGVPLVTVPITYEQPAIATRVQWAGAGKSIPLAKLNPQKLRKCLQEVLAKQDYRVAARQISSDKGAFSGVTIAANIVATALR